VYSRQPATNCHAGLRANGRRPRTLFTPFASLNFSSSIHHLAHFAVASDQTGRSTSSSWLARERRHGRGNDNPLSSHPARRPTSLRSVLVSRSVRLRAKQWRPSAAVSGAVRGCSRRAGSPPPLIGRLVAGDCTTATF